MRNHLYFAVALAFAGAVATGCSSSSSGGSSTDEDSGPPHHDAAADAKADHSSNTPDSGKGETSTNNPDAGTDGSTPPGDAGTDGTTTGDAGPCVFSTFVIGLITNDTTATALPSANLGQACSDDQKQSDFASLF